MSDNDKMREAIIQFGQDNPSLDLDFRLHTHGKYLTQEKAIVASRAFKAGAAWQAAQSEQSVPVAADPGYWQATDGGPNPNYQPDDEQSVPVVGDVLFYASDSTPTAESQIQYDVCAYQKDYSFFPVYRKPTTSITAAELEQLRKEYEQKQALLLEAHCERVILLQERIRQLEAELSESREQAERMLDAIDKLQPLARRALWMAFVWNDHNFTHPLDYAIEEAKKSGLNGLEDAQEFLADVAMLAATKQLKKEGE